MIRHGPRKGQLAAKVRDEVVESLLRLGRERALLYKTAVYTGLRRGELELMQVGWLVLDGESPRVILPDSVAKNRKEASIPLLGNLAADLREWIKETSKSANEPVFWVPKELIKILKRDLAAAGIPYRDSHGRTLDVHALRHTTGTNLARAKVSPRLAQEFMRRRDIKLTLQTYADVEQLDRAELSRAVPKLGARPNDTTGASA
jgi:integrase